MATNNKTPSGIPKPLPTDEIDVVDIQGISDKLETVTQNIEFLDFRDSLSTITGVTYLTALKMGRLHMITFMYKPTSTGFTTNVISDIPAAYRPTNSIAASVGTQDSTPDSSKGISAVLRPTGAINVVAPTATSYDMIFSFFWIA